MQPVVYVTNSSTSAWTYSPTSGWQAPQTGMVVHR